MSLLNLINIGKTAVFASQTALNVTANNISNANTIGYTRQEAILEPSSVVVRTASGTLGMGVRVSRIVRHYDRFIEAQLLGQEQNYGRSAVMDEVLGLVEQVFNDPGGAGLSESLNDFFGAWQTLSSNPEDTAARSVLLSEAGSLVSTMKGMESDILDTVERIEGEIDAAVDEINGIASEIAVLNTRIVAIEAGGAGASANDLRDSRDRLVTTLAGLVEIGTLEDGNGSLTVTVGMRNLVEGDRVNTLSAGPDSAWDTRISLDGIDITSRISKGHIGGLLASRAAIESGPLMGLRRLAAALAKEMNLLHGAGVGLDGTTGDDFFTPLSLSTTVSSAGANVTSAAVTDPAALTLSDYTIAIGAGGSYSVTNRDTGAVVSSGTYASGSPIAFDGISVVVTGAVSAGDSFGVSPLTGAIGSLEVAITDPRRIAAASDAGALPGDNTNALTIAGLADSAVASLGGATFSEYYGELVSEAGKLARDASDLRQFDENLKTELSNRRASVSGVSLDEEATNIIAFQRAYQAGARLISVTDELFQTVLQL